MCSSKRKLRRQQCQGKIAYADYALALAQAERRRLSVYKCSFCHQFHIGHEPAAVKQIMARKGKY